MCFDDVSVASDPVGDPPRSVVRRHVTRSIRESDLPFCVGEERERELVFLGKPATRVRLVETASEDDGVELLEFFVMVPKLGTFFRSAGGVGFRKEPENHVLSLQLAKPDRLSAMIGELEVGGCVTWFQHWKAPSKQAIGDHLEDSASAHG